MEDQDVEGEDSIEMDFQGVGCGAWSGLIWHEIVMGGGLL